MNAKILFLLFFLLLFITPQYMHGQACDPPRPPDPRSPGNDHGDDRYSYADREVEYAVTFSVNPDVSILKSGYYKEAISLISKFIDINVFEGKEINSKDFGTKPVLIIPSGGLYGKEHDAALKLILAEYVRCGGNIIALSQQADRHFSILPGCRGTQLVGYGWASDQSCYSGSSYYENMHPAISAFYTWAGVGTMNSDGYFEEFGENCTVLLRRTKNRKPLAMVYYPFEDENSGAILVTSMFTDWGAAHHQSSKTEKHLLRDFITFMKDARKQMPLICRQETPNPGMQLSVNIKNNTEHTASKVQFTVYNPDRKKIFYSEIKDINLAPGTGTEIPLEFNLTGVMNTDYGISHVDYTLLDAELNPLAEERDGARFAVYGKIDPYMPNNPYDVWITSTAESHFWNQPADITLHVKNYSTEPITINWYYEWFHSFDTPLPSLTVAPGAESEYSFKADFPGYIADYDEIRAMFNLRYKRQGDDRYLPSQKGFFVKGNPTQSKLEITGPYIIKSGAPLNYSIASGLKGDTDPANVDRIIRVSRVDTGGNTIDTVYETANNFNENSSFSYNGAYIPGEQHPPGRYRLKLEVFYPQMGQEVRYDNFYYMQSSAWGQIQPIETAEDGYLLLNHQYPFKFKLSNSSYFQEPLEQVKCTLLVVAESGEEAFRKELTGITLEKGQTRLIEESFTFLPPVQGNYYLKVLYEDETLTVPKVIIDKRLYRFKTLSWLTMDKEFYQYLETAQVNVSLSGVGNCHIKFNSPEAGVLEERDVVLTAAGGMKNEIFPVPVGFNISQSFTIEISSDNGFQKIYQQVIPTRFLQLNHHITFNQKDARVGEAVQISVHINESSGYVSSFPAQLRVYSEDFNIDTTQSIVVQPMVDNVYSVPLQVPLQSSKSYLPARMELTVDNRLVETGICYLHVPDSRVTFSKPAEQHNAGDIFNLTLENSGGKPGEFNIDIRLSDEKGIEILNHQSTASLAPGGQEMIEVSIPANVKTGNYLLRQQAVDVLTNQSFMSLSRIELTGISASLNSFTLKDKYFDDEPVSGKSEIVPGSSGIENGMLQSKIIRYAESKGVEEERPGEFIPYNMIENGYSSGNMLYLVTDKGVLSYDMVAGNVNVLYSFDSNPDFNSKGLVLSSAGELWIASAYDGVWRQNSDDQWEQYTTADGLASNFIYDIIEVNGASGSEFWVATGGGISVYRSGKFENYTTADGLPSNRVYRLALDGNGAIYASTSGGVVRKTFNGASFESIGAPFGTTSVSGKMTGTADGSVWMAAGSQLYQYQPGGDQWQEWNFTDLYPATSVYLHQIGTINGELWIKARVRDADDNLFNVLLRYDAGFVSYTEIEVPGLAGLDTTPIIPGGGDGSAAYFTCEVGFMAFDTATWQHNVIDMDSNKFCGEIQCLITGSLGLMWAGTDYGFSMYDGSQWTNYYSIRGSQLIFDVMLIDTDSENRVYGYCSPLGGILKLDIENSSQENIQLIEFPYSLGYYPQYDDKMAVDTYGRIWLGRKDLYYYDGEWHKYEGVRYVKCMIKDFNGGVWLGSRTSPNDTAGSEFHLVHIKNDFTFDDYTTSNSGLIPWEKDRLYLDENGILWIKHYAYNYNDVRSLQSFDGSNWIDYSNFTGFPALGARDFVKDNNDRLHMVDPEGVLYVLQDNEFGLEMEQSYYSHSLVWWQDRLHCVGYTGDTGGGGEIPTIAAGLTALTSYNNLLSLSSAVGVVEEELWSRTYPVNLLTGGMDTIDLLTAKSFPPGAYELKTALLSPLDQELANSGYGFVVKETGLSVSLFANCSPCGFLKPNTDLGITIEVLNNTSETKSNLDFTMKKISPAGTEEVVLSDTLTLAPGQLETFTLTFNESTTGIWKLAALLIDNSTGEEKESSLLIGMTEPMVTMETLAPGYAGDESFDMQIKLVNNGNITAAAQLTVLASSDGSSETTIDETIVLNPQEERLLTVNDTLFANKDKTYTISLTGDVQETETWIVKYGYVEDFNINILPGYRQGAISIPYTLSNNGGLAFVDDLHVELLPMGGSVPLYTIEPSYNLYPGEAPITGTIDFRLLPGNYVLKYQTSKQPGIQSTFFTVQPSGLGAIAINPDSQYPVGAVDINYSITNTDTYAGQVPLIITLSEDQTGAPVFTETRDYYLAAGETRGDVIHYDFTSIGTGTYTLNFSGPKLAAPVDAVIRIMNFDKVTASLGIGALETNRIPVTVSIENNGYSEFNGSLLIESQGIRHEQSLQVAANAVFNDTMGLDTMLLTPGTREVNASIYDSRGNLLSQTSGMAEIQGADLEIIDIPGNLEVDAGSFVEVPLKLKNEGHLRGEAVLKINAFDNLYQQNEIALDPGEEIQLNGIFIDAPMDLPPGNYPFYYTLTGSGVETGALHGNFNFKVNGLSLEVEASLDRSLYNQGETARLTLDITTGITSDSPLEAVVNWGEFNERKTFTLSSGSQSLVFNILLDEIRDEKVFYGIYHENGKGIHLNDIYLNFRGEISVEPDKQVYAPGEVVQAVFTGEQPGILTAESFGESYTLELSTSASASFQVPADTLGGTHGISWSFVPSEPSQSEVSGSQPFDVIGLVVKVTGSGIEKGKYAPGETINAHYTIEANRDETLEMRCWVMPPSGDWSYLGNKYTSVSSQKQTDAVTSYSFTTTESGNHEFVYALYREDGEQPLASGSMSFGVGDAALLGISPDQTGYKNGNEPVILKIDYFGEGFAQLQVLLDEENVHQQGITINGLGSTEVVVESSVVSGGSHNVKAVLSQNSLTSTKTSGFIYGTNLPDLTTTFVNILQNGLNYSFTIEVTNSGKTVSTATTMSFSDNGLDVETVSIPALEPDQSHEFTFNWNGTGKAGSHELMFEADNTNTVKEFSETNNSLEFTLEVPVLFYSLGTDPADKLIYPANTPINIISRLINNQENPALLTLDLSITNDESGLIIHNRIKEEQIPAFGSKIINDTFNTSVYPAGNYTLNQTVIGDNLKMHEEVFLYFEPTRIVTGTIQVTPQQIPAKTPTEVQLTMKLKNAGNVPLENEILQIDVFNKELGEVVMSEEFSVSIPLAEDLTETKTMSLTLVEGNYEIWLKHNEEILALADLSAISAVKPNQTIAIYPRVLIMNLLPPAARGTLFVKTVPLDPQQKLLINPVDYLSGLLQSQGIEYEIGVRLIDSYVKFNKGQANVNIILGNEMGQNLRDELKEKVFHGEGLILFCDKPAQNPEWIDFLGVTLKPIPGKTRETVIQILPNEFSSEGEIECAEELKRQMIKEKEDVVIIAQTKQKQYPVMAYSKYGKGHILMIAVPLEFKSGIEHMSQLLLNTITTFSQDIYTGSDLTRLLPLELSLKNESSEAATLKIKTFLPYGVEAFDFKPEPEEGEELKWTITVPAVSTETISYWLKLPDQVNSFEIKTELYDEETKSDEVSTTFEVTQTVLFRINELILELDMIGAAGKDAQLVSKARNHLEQIRSRTVNSFMDNLLNLHDSVRSASYLGEVKSVDASAQRLKTQDIMKIMGRRFYEAVKTWGEFQLNSILKLINN
jgi:ligand-binding sensor domain-containing protein